jgi:7-cyano-7-deazaguanine reductase
VIDKPERLRYDGPMATDATALTLLGKSGVPLPAHPDDATLETFANCRPGRRYWITLDCPEFSSLCPVTGQPDTAHLVIRYVPAERCVETKSFKFYLASFRNFPAFNEEIVNRILDDLVRVMAPVELVVSGKFSPRGGIQLTCEARHPQAQAEDLR